MTGIESWRKTPKTTYFVSFPRRREYTTRYSVLQNKKGLPIRKPFSTMKNSIRFCFRNSLFDHHHLPHERHRAGGHLVVIGPADEAAGVERNLERPGGHALIEYRLDQLARHIDDRQAHHAVCGKRHFHCTLACKRIRIILFEAVTLGRNIRNRRGLPGAVER